MLSGKVALVTGGAQGIGLATAKVLLKNKAKVAIIDIDAEVGQATCNNLQGEFSKEDVKFYKTDVTSQEELESAFAKTKEEFCGIDIVCNIAGVAGSKSWRKTLDINLAAVISGTFLGVEYMSTGNGGRGGSIINMSSMAGLVEVPTNPIYAATKHGVVGFSRSMVSQATSDSVRVNCICPSFVKTRMMDNFDQTQANMQQLIKIYGIAEPEDVAEVVLELVMDSSKVGAVVALTAHEKKYLNLRGSMDLVTKDK